MPRYVESVERVVAAAPERIWELVANPQRHRDIDGSGTVRSAYDLPAEVSLGSTFGMHMDFGGPYTMTNTVIEYEPGRRIAWQARPSAGSTRWRHQFGGRIWRYELEPAAGGTLVRESWDLSAEKKRWVVWRYRKKTRANMERTLERIEQLVTG